ncbi:hypothetical protein COU20_01595 [Candidatus Kaiserbacteria bacterium CG10_big_fil_rev_8_21_14_0_10_59_10]|uniref:phenylalanine--tRNA ligase n=1 Tax=Candidatus Kaiserbacteria bacterium CG10_big_fil_rev_8_21_14_0_10_59_10 TaxID=1974612 RepID=A0A2H0U829_9BACT|nr:MAG: hypothetical protein COU20_01595 [Candidatus Kaiserbacteria bacterium CG10_big_fil_rev_8_21_14_0_10_59_10]
MNISRAWLQTYFKAELPAAERLAEALTFHAFEIDGIEGHGGDSVLDVKVTPNRGHDALSHRTIAKELAAILGLPLLKDPLADVALLEPRTDAVRISLEDPRLSPRYIAGLITGVKIGPSPEWLRARLKAIGQRSINNVVDAVNYVMFDLGQPLHAFDAGKLSARGGGRALSVRRALPGENMRSLDGVEYALTDSMLVVADENANAAVAIAGIKGGEATGVGEDTTAIVLESANFNGVTVRRAAQALKLRTDASSRFEQGLSPELAAHGMRAAAGLILETAGGEVQGFADAYPSPQPAARVTLSLEKANALLGTALSKDDVARALERHALSFTTDGDTLDVAVPPERLDLMISEDLVEEVARTIGYEAVPASALPPSPQEPSIHARFAYAERAREALLARGYSEVYTSVFRSEGMRAVLNKVDSDRPFLRSSIREGLTEALQKNWLVKETVGLRSVHLFELGAVWGAKDERMHLAIGSLGGGMEAQEALREVCDELGARIPKGDAKEGVVEVDFDALIEGLPAPDRYSELPASTAERYEPFSRYPYIVRDIAMWIPDSASAEDIERLIREHGGELVRRVDLFDHFEKEGKTSLAFRIIFQSFDRTLYDEDANQRMRAITAALGSAGCAIR